MSEQSSKDQKGKLPQSTETPSAESAELQAALARFNSLLDQATVPPEADDESGSEKPVH